MAVPQQVRSLVCRLRAVDSSDPFLRPDDFFCASFRCHCQVREPSRLRSNWRRKGRSSWLASRTSLCWMPY